MQQRWTVLFCLAFYLNCVLGDFTPDFNQWLIAHFGEDVQRTLERKDMGDVGSYGGKSSADEQLVNQPVVFVHGVSDFAGGHLKGNAATFVKNGYKWSEVYGTTYANGPKGNPLEWVNYKMQCSYVKQVRALIVAVRLYTGRAVDVIGFSLGVPVSRKAILGGRCVDTGEDLGQPLTKFIDTFVGIAGPNQGVPACVVAVLPVCNPETGLFTGICPAQSKYLTDINAQSGYEGAHIFSIFSKADATVGHVVCGKETSAIPGQQQQFVYERENHDQVNENTYDLQRKLVLTHSN